jgi:hypothetical protein
LEAGGAFHDTTAFGGVALDVLVTDGAGENKDAHAGSWISKAELFNTVHFTKLPTGNAF